MTNTSRELLARFFRVFPGFLWTIPPATLANCNRNCARKMSRLIPGFTAAPTNSLPIVNSRRALLSIAEVPDSRAALLPLGEILRTPGLAGSP